MYPGDSCLLRIWHKYWLIDEFKALLGCQSMKESTLNQNIHAFKIDTLYMYIISLS